MRRTAMPKLSLRPFATIEEGLDAYLGYNFTRLENVFERMSDTATGSVVVTGTATVATGLARVDGVVAMIDTDHSAAAAFARALPGAAAGTIDIRVLTNAFLVSAAATPVRWVAVGELVLS